MNEPTPPAPRPKRFHKYSAGRKPIPPGRYIKHGLLKAALKAWEFRNGFAPDPDYSYGRTTTMR